MMNRLTNLLKVENLKTYFYTEDGIIKAVDGVGFSVDKKQTVGIVGESGCGKSITALSIMQLIQSPPGKIIDGKIWFKGDDLLAYPEKRMRHIRGNDISMIFQEPMTSLNPVYTVGNQIIEVLLLHQNMKLKEARGKAINMLETAGIPRANRVIDEFPHQLSGGMKQRAIIAMALACNPKLLIADEPTTALDVTIQAQILNLINAKKEEFKTGVILITHDLGIIAEMAEEVVVMYAGRVVEHAGVIDIFENPMHPYTIGLQNSSPDIKGNKKRLHVIRGSVPDPINMPPGCAFNPRCDNAINICQEKAPVLKELSDGRKVRCWLYVNHEEEREEII